ncbi:MAG: class I SAM-dependent methyltransferase [Clostridia bacterium]|nr:class I SAM-dependent methyltransferase [Clostridia bacterium]
MNDIVKEWYENPTNIDQMPSLGRLKLWEEEVVKHFPLNARVLDVGCGMGREAFALNDMGYYVVGIDTSQAIIDRVTQLAHDNSYDIPFVHYDGYNLPFDYAQFDVVIFWSQTFGLLYGEQKKYDYLNQCRKVTVRNGLLSFSTHDHAYVSKNYGRYEIGNRFYPYANTELYWETFLPEQLMQYATATGYSILYCGSGEVYRPEDGTILHCLCRNDR